MKILEKIKQNKKAIFVAAVLIFNIPLAFGLVNTVSAYVSDGSHQTIINPPSKQSKFSLQNGEILGCAPGSVVGWGDWNDALSIGGIFLTDGDWTTAKCIEDSGGSAALSQYFQEKNGGILNIVGNVQATILEQRPLSTSYYIDQKVYALQNSGVIYAADRGVSPAPYFPSGTGSQLLQPIQAFWGWSVNIVYGFLIILIIGIAFSIMFRSNIEGSVMARIQATIPSIALAMILVPLSYAISGVFIDAITVGTNVVHSFLLGPGSPGQSVYDQRNDNRPASDTCVNQTSDDACDRGLYADDSRVNWFNVQKMVDISDEVTDATQDVRDPLSTSGGSLINNWAIFGIVKTILNLFSGTDSSSAYWFGEIINVIIGLTMIWIGIKILIKLFQKYLMLILMPIMSPFIFATAAVPGTGTKNIIEYIKLMASGSLFYIVTYAMFLLTIIFTSSAFQSQVPEISSGAFVPPLMGLADIFTQGGGSLPLTRFIFTLVGLGIYFSIPKTLEGIDAALQVDNAIPKFIQTPIDSFRESARVTSKFAFRTAPGLAGRGVSITRNTVNGVNPVRQWNRFQQSREDKAGYTQNTPGSRKYVAKDALDTEWASAKRAYDQAVQEKNTGAAMHYKDVMKDIDDRAAKIPGGGVTLDHSTEDKDRLKLNVTFSPGTFGNSDNNVYFTNSLIWEMYNNTVPVFSVGGAPGGRYLNQKAAKLVIKIEGQGYRFTSSSVIEVGLAIDDPKGPAGKLIMDTKTIREILPGGGDILARDPTSIGSFSFGGHFQVTPRPASGPDAWNIANSAIDDGKTYEIPLTMFIDKVGDGALPLPPTPPPVPPATSLFGLYENFASTPSKTQPGYWRSAYMTGGDAALSNKMMFRIKGTDYKSGGFRIFLKKQS